jgi:alpha-1,6-mannosyltransferase
MLYAPHSGGVTRYLREKRAWLARHTSMRHTLVVPALRDGVGPRGEILIRTRAWTRSPYRWPFDASRWVREMAARAPDLIEAGDPGPLGWIARHVASRLSVPLVAFCHADVLRMTAQRYSPVFDGGVRLYLRAFYSRCDVVVAPSRYMKERLAQWGVDRVVVRPLGVDLTTFNPAARTTDLRRKLGLPARRARADLRRPRRAREERRRPAAGLQAPGSPLPPGGRRRDRAAWAVVERDGGALRRVGAGARVPARERRRARARRRPGNVRAHLPRGDGMRARASSRPRRALRRSWSATTRACWSRRATPMRSSRASRRSNERDPDAIGVRARARVEQAYTWDAAMRGLLGVYRGALSRSPVPVPRYVAN